MAELWAFPNECNTVFQSETPGGPVVPGMIVTGYFCATGDSFGWDHWIFYSDFIPEGMNANQIQTRIANGVLRAAEQESPGPDGQPGWFVKQPGDKIIIVGGVSVSTL